MLDLYILIPLIVLLFINLPPFGLMKRLAFWLALGIALAQLIFSLFPQPQLQTPLFHFNLALDNLSQVMLLTISLTMLVSLVAGEYLIHYHNRRFNFINLWLITLAGMNGVVLTRDIFSLYVFLEATALGSFILIVLDRERDSLEGAYKYLLFSALATLLLLISIALITLVVGDTSFAAISATLHSSANSPFVLLLVALFISAFFIKSGLIPFHGWLPDAYSSAPSFVAIMLAGITTKIVGLYPLIRAVHSLFANNAQLNGLLLLVGAISIVVAALAALNQIHFRRLLAYSSISQMGYIVLGLACATPLGLAGAVFHFFNHALFKSLLFVNAAAVEKQTGSSDIRQLGGLAGRMPITGISSAVASLATAGIPPLSGFWSKLLIIIALWQSGHFAYAVIAALASLLTLAYMLKLQRSLFFGKVVAADCGVVEAGWGLSIPAVVLTCLIIGIGLAFPWLINTILIPVSKI